MPIKVEIQSFTTLFSLPMPLRTWKLRWCSCIARTLTTYLANLLGKTWILCFPHYPQAYLLTPWEPPADWSKCMWYLIEPMGTIVYELWHPPKEEGCRMLVEPLGLVPQWLFYEISQSEIMLGRKYTAHTRRWILSKKSHFDGAIVVSWIRWILLQCPGLLSTGLEN